MRRELLGVAACALILPASASRGQAVDDARGYGGFGGQYVQAPSLYYPFPGVIESRFGTYFSAPIVPGTPESDIEAATIDATNAAHEGVDPKAEARAEEVAVEADKEKARSESKAPKAVARARRKSPRVYARGFDRAPEPFNRELPRGNLADINNVPAGIPTYSPYARQQTYGQAYGMGPYGSNYYSSYWHGYAPMNGYPGGPPADVIEP